MNFKLYLRFGILFLLSASCTVTTPFLYSTQKLKVPGKISSDSSFTLKVIDARQWVAYIGQVYSRNGLASNKVMPEQSSITPILHSSFKKILVNQGMRFDSLSPASQAITISVIHLLGEVAYNRMAGNATLKVEISSKRTGRNTYNAIHKGYSDLGGGGYNRKTAFGMAYLALDDAMLRLLSDPTFVSAVEGK